MDTVNFKKNTQKLLMAALALPLFLPQNDVMATTEDPTEESTTQEFTPADDGTGQNPTGGEATYDKVNPETVPTEEVPYNGEPSNEVPSNEVPYSGEPSNEAPSNEVPYNGEPSNEVPSNESPVEEGVQNDGGQANPEASLETPVEEGNTDGTGVNSQPYINAVSVSGQSFEPGDIVTVTIEGSSSYVLSGITATFQKVSNTENTTIDISSFNLTDLGNGYFRAVATYQLPEAMPDTNYSLSGITLSDQAGNDNTISNDNMNFDTGFEVISPVPEDTRPPNLITMYADKDVYAPGDTVTVTVEAEDESEIHQMWAVFTDSEGTPENDSYRMDNMYITQNPLGNYVGVGTFVIAEDAGNATYNLNFVGMSDVHGNEGYFNQYDFGVSFDIMNDTAAETDPPELLEVTTDKDAYKAGETANIEVTASDESEIIGITADFVVEGEEDGKVYSTDLSGIEQDDEGNYVASTEIKLSEKLTGKKIKLADITIVDVYENVGKYNADDEALDVTFDVTEGGDSENVPGDGVAGPAEDSDGDEDEESEEETSEEIAADDQTKGGFLSGADLPFENVLLPAAVLLIFLCTVLFVVLPLRKRK